MTFLSTIRFMCNLTLRETLVRQYLCFTEIMHSVKTHDRLTNQSLLLQRSIVQLKLDYDISSKSKIIFTRWPSKLFITQKKTHFE